MRAAAAFFGAASTAPPEVAVRVVAEPAAALEEQLGNRLAGGVVGVEPGSRHDRGPGGRHQWRAAARKPARRLSGVNPPPSITAAVGRVGTDHSVSKGRATARRSAWWPGWRRARRRPRGRSGRVESEKSTRPTASSGALGMAFSSKRPSPRTSRPSGPRRHLIAGVDVVVVVQHAVQVGVVQIGGPRPAWAGSPSGEVLPDQAIGTRPSSRACVILRSVVDAVSSGRLHAGAHRCRGVGRCHREDLCVPALRLWRGAR